MGGVKGGEDRGRGGEGEGEGEGRGEGGRHGGIHFFGGRGLGRGWLGLDSERATRGERNGL